jgi:transposase InsO family protein
LGDRNREAAVTLDRACLLQAPAWRDLGQVEAATLDWVHWYNTERTHEAIDDPTPSPQKNSTAVSEQPSNKPDNTKDRVPGIPGRSFSSWRPGA